MEPETFQADAEIARSYSEIHPALRSISWAIWVTERSSPAMEKSSSRERSRMEFNSSIRATNWFCRIPESRILTRRRMVFVACSETANVRVVSQNGLAATLQCGAVFDCARHQESRDAERSGVLADRLKIAVQSQHRCFRRTANAQARMHRGRSPHAQCFVLPGCLTLHPGRWSCPRPSSP